MPGRIPLLGLLAATLAAGPLVGAQEDLVPTGGEPRLQVELYHQSDSLAFSPDGTLLASGGLEGTVKVMEARTGLQVRVLWASSNLTGGVAFQPGGMVLAGGGEDGTITLWDARGGEQTAAWTAHGHPMAALAFSPGGETLASASGSLKLWHVEGRKLVASSEGHAIALAFSADGKVLASASGDRTVKLWEAPNLKELRVLKGHLKPVRAVAFSDDGKYLATAGDERAIILWNPLTGSRTASLTSGGGGDAISLDFTPGGRTLASSHKDGLIKLWAMGTRKEVARLSVWNAGDFAFSPDGATLAFSSAGQVHLCDLKTAKDVQIAERVDPTHNCRFALGGGFLVLGRKLFDLESAAELPPLLDDGVWATCLAASPPGGLLALGGRDGKVRLREPAGGEGGKDLTAHAGEVRAVAFSADGRLLASGGADRKAKLWRVEEGKLLHELAGHSEPIACLAFDPKGGLLATGSHDNAIKLWSTAGGKEVRTLSGHSNGVRCLAFSGDGRTLASGSNDRTARLWAVETGQTTGTLTGHSGAVASIAFVPGKQAIAAGSYRKVLFFDLEGGKPYQELSRHLMEVEFLAFSPGGKVLITGTDEGVLRSFTIDGTVARERGSLHLFQGGDWVAADPLGHFDGSREGNVPHLHWSLGDRAFPLERFKEQYYRRGILARLFRE